MQLAGSQTHPVETLPAWKRVSREEGIACEPAVERAAVEVIDATRTVTHASVSRSSRGQRWAIPPETDATLGYHKVTCEHSLVKRIAQVVLGAAVLVIALSLAGCAAPAVEPAAERTADATVAADTPAATPPIAPASPTPTSTHPVDPRDTAYDTQVAAWADAIPEGFAWPESITGLPAGRWHGNGDWSGYTSAAGIYHCMLVYAAWDAYFVDNDPIASRDYAAQGDATMPDVPYPNDLTRSDGSIDDQALASESGICNGFVGDLRE